MLEVSTKPVALKSEGCGIRQLPDFVNNRFSKRFLILALQSSPEFPQKNLLAPLRADIDWPLSSTLFLGPDFSNVVVILRHRLLHPSAGSCATAYEFFQYVYVLRRNSDLMASAGHPPAVAGLRHRATFPASRLSPQHVRTVAYPTDSNPPSRLDSPAPTGGKASLARDDGRRTGGGS